LRAHAATINIAAQDLTGVNSTGATGYIGGEALQRLSQTHPEYSIRALVRDASKASIVKAAFPNVQIVEGDLDSAETIAREAAEAEIVLHLAATGHLNSVQAIYQGILSNTAREKPAHWIQISGASLLAAPEIASPERVPGSPSDEVFDDLNGVSKIRDLIKAYPTRAVDNYIFDVASNTDRVNTALVVPPIIYGEGRGPVKTRSVQIDELVKVTLQRKKGVQVGKGLSRWGNVHSHDLSQLVLLLVERAAQGGEAAGVWNLDGIYLTGLGEKV
jgi:nucleoside-diphosphate-sugar epimerase